VTVILRDEPLPEGATVLIHMGAGAVATALDAAVRHYGEYRSVTGNGLGIYAVSVFAVVGGVTEAEILDALPQRSYGHSTVGAIRDAGFELLATSMIDDAMDVAIVALQPAHFDVVLPELHDARLRTNDPLDDADLETVARAHLSPHVEQLLALFEPRRRK
jgi:hypothetical protein